MGKKNGIPKQPENTWRLVLDLTEEQAMQFRDLMGGTNYTSERILDLMRIGKSQVDGYVFIKQPDDSDWKRVQFTFDGKSATLYKAVKERP
jgi:hypothetical protein